MSATATKSASSKSSSKVLVHETRNSLPASTREQSVELLNALLADGIDLALAIKQAHWNMRGPNFIGIHELMDQFREDMDAGNDELAERVSQLGGAALGTVQAVSHGSRVKPYPLDIFAMDEHLDALIERFATVANGMRDGIETADEAGDQDTADILTEISRTLDKNLWFLESHLPVK